MKNNAIAFTLAFGITTKNTEHEMLDEIATYPEQYARAALVLGAERLTRLHNSCVLLAV